MASGATSTGYGLLKGPLLADVIQVGPSYLASRLETLRRAQNPDGGWSYFPGKKSWLEPTVYAALALHGTPEADSAWKLLLSWQGSDGSWRPSSDVLISTLAHARGEHGQPFLSGMRWLLALTGTETDLRSRILTGLGLVTADRNVKLKGWPWKPDTSSWVEPTSHALVTLKQAAPKVDSPELRERVRMGEEELLDLQCRDLGWNYGNRTVLGVDLPSYPETTGLALVGLQGRKDVGPSLDLAAKMLASTRSPLARVWLTIALKVNQAPVPAVKEDGASPDVMLTALEALAAPDGNYRVFAPGGAA
jgi:hypothetical protein